MGKRTLQRRRGKGGIQWRGPKKGKIMPARYPLYRGEESVRGIVTEIVHERGRSAPLSRVEFENFPHTYVPAVQGLSVGSTIQMGPSAPIVTGNILPLSKIPEGTTVCNIEKTFGDGGRLVRASGGSAILFSQTPGRSIIKMPSGKGLSAPNWCRAMVGVIAGGGRPEKPFLRAGRKFWKCKAKVQPYPRMRGIAMAAVYHPFGGGRHQHPGKSTSTSRNAPPGRKVGHIAPRKTGRKRIARKIIEVKR
jgi:large subunit ribosomal protein L2